MVARVGIEAGGRGFASDVAGELCQASSIESDITSDCPAMRWSAE